MGPLWGKVDRQGISLAVIYGLLVALPIFGDRFITYLSTLFMIFALFAMGYNVMFGYAGLLSFGHSLFFAASAYATALFSLHIMRDVVVGLVVGVGVAIVLALVVGALTLKTGTIYFAMLTLAFAMLFYAFLLKRRDLTGGTDGLYGIPRASFIGDLTQLTNFYFFALLVFVVIVTMLYALDRSSTGLILRALGNNEDRVEFSGHSVFKYRMVAFVISAGVSGAAGSLNALLIRVVTPDFAYWTTAAEPLIITLLGGASYFLGPMAGALFYVIITTASARVAEIWALILGLTLVAILLGFRGGIMGVVYRIWQRKS